ncbi:hypothetical protein ACC684_28515 [Rhizobium ruizarguesonis]
MSEPISERWAFRSGWLGLIQEAQAEIGALPAAWNARLVGGKEKFGYLQLSINWQGHARRDRIEAITERYRKRSLTICEECGKLGRLRMGISIAATRCDDHAEFAAPFRDDDGRVVDLPPMGGPIYADGSQGNYSSPRFGGSNGR